MKAKKTMKTTSAEAEVKKLSTGIRKVLRGFGHEVPQSHMLHALASAQGSSNWHVFKNIPKASAPTETSPVPEMNRDIVIKNGDYPLDRGRLKKLVESDGPITVVLPVDMEYMFEGDIERLNDEVSERITGSCCGLIDIAYEVAVGYDFGTSQIPLKVLAGDVDFETIDFSPGELRLGRLIKSAKTPAKDVWVSLYDGLLYRDSEGREHFDDFEDNSWGGPTRILLGDQPLLVAYDEDLEKFKAITFDANQTETDTKPRRVVSLKLAIEAETHSDDRRFEVEFDARKWFEQASDEAILKLAEVNFGGDYPADDIAQWMAGHHPQIRDMFKYISVMDDVGYEVYVNEESALAWLRHNRPKLVNRVLCALNGVDLIQAEEPEIVGRWDWIDRSNTGDACDMSFDTLEEAAEDAVRALKLDDPNRDR
jgi:hypothetical protein